MAYNPNFYAVAPIGMLDVPLPIEPFSYIDDDGISQYHTINSFMATIGHTVERYSNDGSKFLKGFEFDVANIDTIRAMLVDFNLAYEVDVFILTHAKALKLLATPEWKKEEIL